MRMIGFRRIALMAAMLVGTLWLLPVHTWAHEPADLTIELVAADTEMVVGVETLWQIRLQVPDGQRVEHLKLRPIDPVFWHWPDGEHKLDSVTNAITLSVAVVPLAAGERYPSLEAEYVLDGTPRTQVSPGSALIRVIPLSDRITVQTWDGASTVMRYHDWTAEVCVRNDASLPLTGVTIQGQGPGLAWRSPSSLAYLPPGRMHCERVPATAWDLYPAPHLQVRYSWQDAIGGMHDHVERFALTPPQVLKHWSQQMLDKVPENSLSVLLGAFIAGITS